MTDKWFLEEVTSKVSKRKRLVIIDPEGLCKFLVESLSEDNFVILKTDKALKNEWETVKEELFIRYQAETEYKDQSVIFYAQREIDKLSFLFDYCKTHGEIDLTDPYDWLRKKIHSATGMQAQMENSLLLTTSKIGKKKDIIWWRKVIENLEGLINIEDELLRFLNGPANYFTGKDDDVRRLIEGRFFELLELPMLDQPPKTLAKSIADRIFTGLLNNNIQPELLKVYDKWTDSESLRPSFINFRESFRLPGDADPNNAHAGHCFEKLDIDLLKDISSRISDREYRTNMLQIVRNRIGQSIGKPFIPLWWNDVIELLSYKSDGLGGCRSLDAVVEYYTGKFYVVDRAIRNLYTKFLSEPAIMRPLQEFYESLNLEISEQWYQYSNEYTPNQKAYLPNILHHSQTGVAIIVGDGLRYEMAAYVASKLKDKYAVTTDTMLAEMPSETENNMSALYSSSGRIISTKSEREQYLTRESGKNVTYKNLESFNGELEDYLVLSYKDIDQAAETLQMKALNLFSEFELILTEKIQQLLECGYREVHVVSDHGFVLTGLLEESDKVDPAVNGRCEVHERFIRAEILQNRNELLKFEKDYNGFKYVYAAKTHKPFRTRGVYGYSHGGFSPQEIIVPRFTIRKRNDDVVLAKVSIVNKDDLRNVVGENFIVKLKASADTEDLFTSSRKIQVQLFAGNNRISTGSIIELNLNEEQSQEFTFDSNSELKVLIIDAVTKATLDTAEIKKSDVRDTGGLFD